MSERERTEKGRSFVLFFLFFFKTDLWGKKNQEKKTIFHPFFYLKIVVAKANIVESIAKETLNRTEKNKFEIWRYKF